MLRQFFKRFKSLDAAQETILQIQKHIMAFQHVEPLKREWTTLQALIETATPKEASQLHKKCSKLQHTIDQCENLIHRAEEYASLVQLCKQDEAMTNELLPELNQLNVEAESFALKMLLSDPVDECGAIIEIRAGSGGDECCGTAMELTRMYMKWGQSKNHSVSLLEAIPDGIGYRSATVKIDGEYAYGWLKHETGIHRMTRVSKTDSMGRKHTTFVSIQVLPYSNESSDPIIEIHPKDLKIDVMRAQGPGGQHVNTTESCVRITHLPTGIAVTCQNERSQVKNKMIAMKLLEGKLYQIELKKRQEEKMEKYGDLPDNSWGNQIRTYTSHQYNLVKDSRTGYETTHIRKVLDGDLDEFLRALVIKFH